MTRRLLDYDPLTGVRTYFEFEPSTERTLIHTEQDVQHILDQNAVMRNDADYSRKGIKEDWWHYARVPNGVILDMKTRFGVDMMAPKPDWKSILKILNREYPHLKVTEKTHA
jgi:hypothetical protein